MQDKQATGIKGETLAANMLQQKGFRILKRNFRSGRAEIDLIAVGNELLLFAEVKTRRGANSFGFPEEAVDRKKAARIIRAAEVYINLVDWKGDIRFDIIAVHLPLYSDKEPQIYHFEDAFY